MSSDSIKLIRQNTLQFFRRGSRRIKSSYDKFKVTVQGYKQLQPIIMAKSLGTLPSNLLRTELFHSKSSSIEKKYNFDTKVICPHKNGLGFLGKIYVDEFTGDRKIQKKPIEAKPSKEIEKNQRLRRAYTLNNQGIGLRRNSTKCIRNHINKKSTSQPILISQTVLTYTKGGFKKPTRTKSLDR